MSYLLMYDFENMAGVKNTLTEKHTSWEEAINTVEDLKKDSWFSNFQVVQIGGNYD